MQMFIKVGHLEVRYCAAGLKFPFNDSVCVFLL